MQDLFKDRVQFLIKYSQKKSLLEQTGPGITSTTNLDTKPKVDSSDKSKEYPNFCSYPKNAILPGKNEVGISGLEVIPEGYCCYPIPMPDSKTGGVSYIFLPTNAKIEFWNEIAYDYFFKNILKISEEKKIKYFDYYSKIFPYGTVFSFEISGLSYVSWMKHERESKFGFFDWYYTDNQKKEPYPKIKWTDPRSDYQKIVDEWITAAQWATSAAFFIAGFFSEGSTWLLLAEMMGEGTLGMIGAQRELEKGENVAAAFDLLFATTPFLKSTKLFSNIDNEAANNLVRSMRKANLNKNSSPQEIYEWYLRLGENEKDLWTKMVKGGSEMSESRLKTILTEDGLTNFKKWIKENPDKLKNISWFKRVNNQEFTLSIFLSVIDVIVESFYGDKLNDLEKKKLTTIYNNSEKISKELANEVKMNFLANADKAKEILTSDNINELLKPEKIPASFFNTELKDAIESKGGTYFESDTDSTIAISNKITSEDEILKYIELGYKKAKNISNIEMEKASKPIKLNGEWYWLIN